MTISNILTAIDEELSLLREVRQILVGGGISPRTGNSTSLAFGPNGAAVKRKPLSKAARAKIAAAQRRRWAKQKTAVKKAA